MGRKEFYGTQFRANDSFIQIVAIKESTPLRCSSLCVEDDDGGESVCRF